MTKDYERLKNMYNELYVDYRKLCDDQESLSDRRAINELEELRTTYRRNFEWDDRRFDDILLERINEIKHNYYE